MAKIVGMLTIRLAPAIAVWRRMVQRARGVDGGWAAVAVGVAAFTAYVATLYPDVPGGDSGELIAAAASGGVIHPPGYPLYALLGRLFAHIPHGTLAWRLNLLSATCGALAAAVLCLAVARWSRSAWAGLAAASLFAFAPGVWQYAVVAEVFALDNLAVAALVLLAVAYAESRDRRCALLGAFVFGLGLANHHTILFTGVPLALWMLWLGHPMQTPRTEIRRELGPLFLAFGAGLTPYLVLPFAGAVRVPVTWGATDTWSGFWTHVLRREFGTFRLAVPGIAAEGSAPETLVAWLRDLVVQVGWWGVALGAVGLVASLRAARVRPFGWVAPVPPLLGVLVVVALGNLPVADPLHRGIVARFWQQPDLYWFAWCGWGLAWIGRRAPWRLVGPALCLAVACLQPATHWRQMDRHHSHLVHDYGEEILRALPRGALVLTKGDLITNSVRYVQLAEGRRPDVRVIDQELLATSWEPSRLMELYPELAFPAAGHAAAEGDEAPASGFTIRQFIDANAGRMPVVVCGGFKEGDLAAHAAYVLSSLGLCESVHPTGTVVGIDAFVEESAAALPQIDFAGQARPPGSWEEVVWNDYWAARERRAADLITMAGHDVARRPRLAMAAAILEDILRSDPQAPALVYKALAIADGRIGLDTAEQRSRTAEAWRQYLRAAPRSDPQLPAIERELQRLTGGGPAP
jgi:hypothetical protein